MTTPPSPNLRQQLRDIISPQALVAALAAAAVAALVGKLTAYLFVALAIFFFAVAATAAICRARTGPLAACLQDVANTPSAEDLACMRASGVGRRLRSTLKANVYVETVPGARLLPVMLYPPDEAANLGA